MLIIAVSIPLSILASIVTLSALGETINLTTLGDLALAVGILADDATVTIGVIVHAVEAHKTEKLMFLAACTIGPKYQRLPAVEMPCIHRMKDR